MYFFLTDKCIGIIKISGVRKFCPNNKFPDKSSAGLTRLDCYKLSKRSYPGRQVYPLIELKKYIMF